MKISIKLTKKERELYKKEGNYTNLWFSDPQGESGFWGGGLDDDNRAFGVQFRKNLYKVLKELEE